MSNRYIERLTFVNKIFILVHYLQYDELTAAPSKDAFTVEEHNNVMNNKEENDMNREVYMTTSTVELVLNHNNINQASF